MSDRIDELKAKLIEKKKRLALLKAGFSYDDSGDYVAFIDGDNEEELEEEAQELLADVKAHNTAKPDAYHDPRGWNPFN